MIKSCLILWNRLFCKRVNIFSKFKNISLRQSVQCTTTLLGKKNGSISLERQESTNRIWFFSKTFWKGLKVWAKLPYFWDIQQIIKPFLSCNLLHLDVVRLLGLIMFAGHWLHNEMWTRAPHGCNVSMRWTKKTHAFFDHKEHDSLIYAPCVHRLCLLVICPFFVNTRWPWMIKRTY